MRAEGANDRVHTRREERKGRREDGGRRTVDGRGQKRERQ